MRTVGGKAEEDEGEDDGQGPEEAHDGEAQHRVALRQHQPSLPLRHLKRQRFVRDAQSMFRAQCRDQTPRPWIFEVYAKEYSEECHKWSEK